MSVMGNDDLTYLQDEVMELESKIVLMSEVIKTLEKRLKKLEKIACDKGLIKDSEEDVCIIC
tara:strand:+ start:406 stop:591 length:186 start_codon:yes stop_codon:yes gene_type:complete